MNYSEKYLKPHSIFGELSFDEYCSRIPSFSFKKEVPEDVVRNFEVVEKLLALSYFEYKFIDEAYAKAIHTFEMAMSIRYKDFFNDGKKQTFNTLITELSKLNLFESNIEVLKYVKQIRNFFSHPERHSFGGIVYWGSIEFITYLINEMYEDVLLRLERKKLFEEFEIQLKKANLEKSLVMEIDGKCTILFSLQLLFINNKLKPETYLFACKPLFDLKQDGSITVVPVVFSSKLSNPNFNGVVLTGEDFSEQNKVTFSPIDHYPQLIPKFEEWNSEYGNLNNKFVYESSTSGIYFNKIFFSEVNEFQMM